MLARSEVMRKWMHNVYGILSSYIWTGRMRSFSHKEGYTEHQDFFIHQGLKLLS